MADVGRTFAIGAVYQYVFSPYLDLVAARTAVGLKPGKRADYQIKPSDPYEHYRRPGSSCFEKLFDQEEIARFERETAMGQAGMGHLYGDEWAPRGIWEW